MRASGVVIVAGIGVACGREVPVPRETPLLTVPWTQRSAVVEVEITRGAWTERLALAIDTGAERTAVSGAAFERLFGVDATVGRARSVSAASSFEHDLGRVDRLQFGDVDLANVVVMSCPTCGLDGDGVLGQNVLREVDMAWRADSATVSLKRSATTHDDAWNLEPMLGVKLGGVDGGGARPIRVRNEADLDVADVVLEVRCAGDVALLEAFALSVGERRRVGSVPARWDCEPYVVEVVGGFWDE